MSADTVKRLPLDAQRRAPRDFPLRLAGFVEGEIRVHLDQAAAIGEVRAISDIEIGFRRHALGQQQVVPR